MDWEMGKLKELRIKELRLKESESGKIERMRKQNISNTKNQADNVHII
jgi:hypothetical protein